MNYKETDVSIEYAHTYLGSPIKKDDEIGAKTAKYIKEIFEDCGLSTTQLVLIDDYNHNPYYPTNMPLEDAKSSYWLAYEEFLESLGIKPTHLVWESDCIGPAKALLEGIPTVDPCSNQQGKYQKNGSIYLLPKHGPNPEKKIKVVDNGKYQCPLLAAVSEAAQVGLGGVSYKALNGTGHYAGKCAVVVLPLGYGAKPWGYEEIEAKSSKILKVAYGEVPVFNYFFEPNESGLAPKWEIATELMERQEKFWNHFPHAKKGNVRL